MINYDLKKMGVDYLLVNSTNKYLLEYVPIEENSVNKLTGFTGDVGDALVCPDGKILLFVDSRFHIQADLEVDKSKVEVVKLKLGQNINEEICSKIAKNSTVGVDLEKVSQARLEVLKAFLGVLNSNIKAYSSNEHCRTGEYVKINFENEKLSKIEDNILITKSEELSYLCNIRSFSFNYSTKVDGKLLIVDNKPYLFTDYKGNELDYTRPLSEFKTFISNLNCQIKVDKSSVNALDYSLIKNPVSIESPIKQMKAVKTDAEIKHMEFCFDMTDKALKATRDWIYSTDNITEYDIAKELENNFKKFGAKSLSFKSIVAINQNSALAHYNKSDKTNVMKDGDLVLIDCGAYYEGGLATDITRVFVKGEPKKLQKEVYTTVLKVFLNCFNYQMTSQTTGYEIDKLAHYIFDSNKIKGFEFSHGLGHGVGIGVHEAPPNLSKNEIAKTIIQENMCFTIEPGLYNEKEFGVRLENTCHLKNGEIISFAKMCFEKKLIEYNLLTEYEKDILANFEVI